MENIEINVREENRHGIDEILSIRSGQQPKCIILVTVMFLIFLFTLKLPSVLSCLYLFVYLFDSTEWRLERREKRAHSTQYCVSYYTGMLLENWRDSSNLNLTNIVLSRALI